MPNLSALQFPPDSWAEVRSHDRVTRYRRSGTGPAVLVLQPADGPGALWPELLPQLEESHRLIVPEAPPAGIDIAHWLADFLEGLGLAPVAVVAADAFCIPVLELVLLGADQVTRVVLVPNGHAGDTGLEGTLAPTIRDDAVALLVVRRGLSASEALPLVSGFFSGAEVLPPG
jgi:hypothetical protein